jgi:hypothetical protein
MVIISCALFKSIKMNKIYKKRKKYPYRYINHWNLIIIIPKCELKKEMFNNDSIDWKDYKLSCLELLAILKAWQIQQTKGLDWFYPNEEILDDYNSEWRHLLLKLIRLKIVEVNPHNSKLNFKVNTPRHQKLPNNAKIRKRLQRLEEFLVQIDFDSYNEFFNERNQNKLRLKSNNF